MLGIGLRARGESRWVSGLVVVALATLAAYFVGRATGVPVRQVYFGYVRTILLLTPIALLMMAVPLTLVAMAKGVKGRSPN